MCGRECECARVSVAWLWCEGALVWAQPQPLPAHAP
jgi:hypothetical protein